ncbi:cytochrome c4 [Paraburkholderia steynii]|uniref:Cytochrome c4 n=1 Tax=Paraburkholderia steynii TaxID=1245441 RepID=A0A4R0X1X3_9BURK|nr:cytochrome c4 [Paraburkholderia steynii]
MNRMAQIFAAGLLVASSGCHDMERSRQVDNPAVAGRTIALQVCSNCHGVNGVSVSPTFPKLAGQTHQYLVDQITDFKTHSRSDPNARRFMWGFTHLTETQIEDLATYFSDQATEPGEPAAPKLMDEGRTIFTSGLPAQGVAACVACHGQHGEGAGQFPRLAGQHADYVVKQLRVFQQTDTRPRGATMKAICTNMSEQDMRAVAAYVEAFPQAPAAESASPVREDAIDPPAKEEVVDPRTKKAGESSVNQ